MMLMRLGLICMVDKSEGPWVVRSKVTRIILNSDKLWIDVRNVSEYFKTSTLFWTVE